MATGHVRPRTTKNGKVKYQVIIESEKDPLTGKRTRTYKTVNGNKKQAEQLMRKMLDEVENGNMPQKSSAVKFKDWINRWVQEYLPNIEETTRAGYKEKIKTCIIPELGNIPLNALKTDHIQSWVNYLREERELSPKSIKNAFHNVNASLKKAVKLRLIPYNPCEGVELPKLRKYTGKVYTKEQIDDVLKITQNTDMFLPVLLGFCVGLRRGEMLALRWEDVDFETKNLYIHRNMVLADGKIIEKEPKSEAGIRHIPVGDRMIKHLKNAHTQYLQDKLALGKGFFDDGYVIRQKNGKYLRPDSLTQKWGRFIKRNNLPHIRFHDTRHSCATEMIASGIDPKTAQTRLGHADVSITMNIYTHATENANKAAAEKIDEMMLANF